MRALPRHAFALAMLFGAVLGAVEGLVLLQATGLRFAHPALEVFGLQWRYALVCAVLVPIAWWVAGLLRLKRDTPAALASWVLGFGIWLLGNYWIQGHLLRGTSMFGGIGLIWLLGLTADVFLIHFLVRALAARAARPALGLTIAAALALPFAASWVVPSDDLGPRTDDYANKPDVTVVVIDTLRADHLGSYGYQRPDGQAVSPVIDRLAADGAVFENCWSQAPWTRPSMASMHSGLFCSSHKVNTERGVLGDDAITMAELMYRQGYRTGGYSANFNVSVSTGFGQGFEELWTVGLERPLVSFTGWGDLSRKVLNTFLTMFIYDGEDHAELVNQQVFDWIDRTADDPRPLFTYVHYIDPHTPYSPPEDGWLFDTPRIDPTYAFRAATVGAGEFPFHAYEDPGEQSVADVITAYDAEIRYVDQQLGRLLDKLRAAGRLDPGDWLFLTSDHGEEFYEHGGWGHGGSLFEEQLHVPFIVVGPGVAAGSRIANEIRLLDIHSTVGLIAGNDPEELHGKTFSLPLQPLFDPAQRDPLAPRRLFAERIQSHELYAFRSNFQKMIEQPDVEALALDERSKKVLMSWFDLRTNSGEVAPFTPADLWAGKALPREADTYQPSADLYDAFQEMKLEVGTLPLDGVLKDYSAAERARLQALGYLDEDGNPIHGGAGVMQTRD